MTTMAPHAAREQYRGTARDLRENAGIERKQVEAVADFGAAARRLRASVRGGADSGVMRRPAPVRDAADANRRRAELGARAIDLVAIADAEAAAADARAEHPAGKPRRFRLRAVR